MTKSELSIGMFVVPVEGGLVQVVIGWHDQSVFIGSSLGYSQSMIEIPVSNLAKAPSGDPYRYVTAEEIATFEIMDS